MINGKAIIVVGGAGLLGTEITKGILKEGGHVAIAEKNTTRANALKSELLHQNTDWKDKILIEKIDITNKASVANAIRSGHHFFGGIDGLVNTAYPKPKDFGKSFFDVEYNTFCKSLNMHLGGYFITSQAFGDYIKEGQRPSSLVNIASIYGVIPPRFEIYEGTEMTNGPEYAVIKAGIIHLTKFLTKEFSGLPINVNTVSPGGIEDGQPEKFVKAYNNYCSQKGMLNPQDIVGTVLFLLSDYSRYVSGQNIVIDDGFSL